MLQFVCLFSPVATPLSKYVDIICFSLEVILILASYESNTI